MVLRFHRPAGEPRPGRPMHWYAGRRVGHSGCPRALHRTPLHPVVHRATDFRLPTTRSEATVPCMSEHLARLSDDDGLFLRRDALAAGLDDDDLARALRAGSIHRVRHGAYALKEHWNQLDAIAQHRLRSLAVLRSSRTKLVVSHISAVVAMGAPLWDLPLDEVHVARLDGRANRHGSGVRQHRGLLLPEDVDLGAHPPMTSPIRTLLDLTTITDVEHALPVADHLLHTELIPDRKELVSRWRRWKGAPGSLTAQVVVRLADARIESLAESRTHHLLWRHGLPAPEPQFVIEDAAGREIARVDFAWPALGVFLEFDGKVKYERFRREGESVLDVVLREKKREENICRVTGWRCIRIVWADLQRPAQTAAYIRSVLAGGPVH